MISKHWGCLRFLHENVTKKCRNLSTSVKLRLCIYSLSEKEHLLPLYFLEISRPCYCTSLSIQCAKVARKQTTSRDMLEFTLAGPQMAIYEYRHVMFGLQKSNVVLTCLFSNIQLYLSHWQAPWWYHRWSLELLAAVLWPCSGSASRSRSESVNTVKVLEKGDVNG